MMKQILVVDDDADFLHLLSLMLRKNVQTYEATGVKDAIKLLETVRVDAICSDFSMKDGTGLELLKILRQRDVKIPFLVMSGHDDRRLAYEVRKWSASFCCKTDYELVAKIMALVNTPIADEPSTVT